MHSLRVRLLLATLLVATVAVVASALFSRSVVTTEFKRFVLARGPARLEAVTAALDRVIAATGSLAGADSILARSAPQVGHGLLLVAEDGEVVAASAPELRTARVTAGDSGTVTIEGRTRDGLTATGMAIELMNPPSRVVRDRDGRTLATLLALPMPEREEGAGGAQPPFLRSVNRGLWAGAAAAIVLGAVLVWLLSGRIVGPIEALTAAARRLERGDLTPRVAASGRDEVATLGRGFNAMAESLARAQRLRLQLTHDVAHELRTPLTNLRAQIEALEDGLLPASPETLASLHEEVMLLTRLVEDLAQLADAESGTLKLEPAAVGVRDALEAAAAAFRARAEEGGVTLEVRADPGIAVRADPARLGQILRNLIANALTHTPRGGGVTLEARAAAGAGGGPAAVELQVRDTGAGIAPEHLPHVFERFYRADPSRSRATGGAGLGLAIVRHLAEAQGGDVRAESEPGRGTRMVVRLPAAP